MSRYAAFLRAINVSGRRVTNVQLRSCFAGMGLTDVATFRASGNVVFSADGADHPDDISLRIETGLARALGYDVPAFLRSADEIRAIAQQQPFAVEFSEAANGKLQVALLSAEPSAPAERELMALASNEDRLAIRGRELYWLPRGGLLESPLDMSMIAAMLGPMTMRTKGTIEHIAAKYV